MVGNDLDPMVDDDCWAAEEGIHRLGILPRGVVVARRRHTAGTPARRLMVEVLV